MIVKWINEAWANISFEANAFKCAGNSFFFLYEDNIKVFLMIWELKIT